MAIRFPSARLHLARAPVHADALRLFYRARRAALGALQSKRDRMLARGSRLLLALTRDLRGRATTHDGLVPRRPPAETGPALAIEVLPSTPGPATIERWLLALETDRGCAPRSADTEPHAACHAAKELGTLRDANGRVLESLEDAVTRAGRPGCVQRAAIEALASIASPDAQGALARMATVTRNRLAWDGRAEDRALLQQLELHAR